MMDHDSGATSVDVLIAEDDTLMREAVRSLLEKEGYRCSEANDGRKAVELALRTPPRCAILDLAMPGLDGFAVARALRSHPRTRGVRIHCLTGRGDPSSREEATRAGIETYLMKPLEPVRLLRLLRGQLCRPQTLQASGLTLDQARDQLDHWEALGFTGLESGYEDGKGFTVRCRRP